MKLREARLSRFLTQTDLAKLAGVATITIRKIEGGEALPRVQTAKKLASALKMKPEDIDEARAYLERQMRGR